MPSCFTAFCRPWLASWLNDRSFRPPMSVTRPTLIFLPCGALDAELLLELLPPLSSLLPQAATPKAPTARVRAIEIARVVLRCTAPPLVPPRGDRTPSAPARSLRRLPVAVVQSREQGRTERRFGEARLDRGAGEGAQLVVAHAEVLARGVVLAAHGGAEVGRVVGGERDPHAGVAQGRQRMGREAREHAEDDVARGAALEH